ncbi:histidine kinase [Erythrobacter longus]|uniref:Histidine kinase n=1 Tax=Erythrobacter longus TaxID=1044 RepID=A0A074MUY4_ERYLO|nr:histidine kinase [Erythrobacter longus]KEO89432.1 histidine kinase [Erythrobacter longus]
MDLSRTPETPVKKGSASVPFRTVLLSAVLLWGAYFLLITLRTYVFELDMQVEMAARRFLVTLAAIGLTFVLWALLRLVDRFSLWIKIFAASLFAIPVAGAIGQINHFVFEDIQTELQAKFAEERGFRFDGEGNLIFDLPEGVTVPAPGPDGSSTFEQSESLIIVEAEQAGSTWRSVLEIALGRYFLLLAWSSTYFALLAGTKARVAERREQQFRSAAKAAELRSLRYQVNPHFLFNTLNSLSALVMTGKAEQAERMIQTMSRFYRHSLADEPTSDVTLKDEFDLQKLYLDIEAVRFPERLKPVFNLPESLEEARVPGMILQPLVENSVKYAVSAVTRPVTVTVAAHEEFDRLVITISDDGPGIPEGAPHGFGIGLANVSDRLEARFGSDIAFTSTPVPGGYRTEIRIPLSKPRDFKPRD